MKTKASDEYERAVMTKLRGDFAGPGLRVRGTDGDGEHKVIGRYSFVPRQLDAAVYRGLDARPFFMADAKCYKDPIDVKDVEMFIGMMDDVGASVGLLVAPRGYSPGAKRRAIAASVCVQVLTVEQATEIKWRDIARQIYPHDWMFHGELSSAYRALSEDGAQGDACEMLELVPFDEWVSFVRYAIRHRPEEARQFLVWVALNHLDHGWRFNAAQQLLEHNLLDEGTSGSILKWEKHPDIVALVRGDFDG